MAIEYQIVKQVQEKWGIDVIVLFQNDVGKNDVGKTVTKTFRFDDQAQIDSDFDTRMAKAIDNYIDSREREITPHEICDKLIEYFKTNDTLTRAQAVAFMSDKVLVEGAL